MHQQIETEDVDSRLRAMRVSTISECAKITYWMLIQWGKEGNGGFQTDEIVDIAREGARRVMLLAGIDKLMEASKR